MRIFRLVLVLGFAAYLFYTEHKPDVSVREQSSVVASQEPPAITRAVPANASIEQPATAVSRKQPVLAEGVPAKAWRVLEIIRSTGQAPEGYVGGRVFQNREGHLPEGGDYREFDVDPHRGGRNAERLVVEWKTKKAWYTADHYQTFTPLP